MKRTALLIAIAALVCMAIMPAVASTYDGYAYRHYDSRVGRYVSTPPYYYGSSFYNYRPSYSYNYYTPYYSSYPYYYRPYYPYHNYPGCRTTCCTARC